jgi:hypothetical protein
MDSQKVSERAKRGASEAGGRRWVGGVDVDGGRGAPVAEGEAAGPPRGTVGAAPSGLAGLRPALGPGPQLLRRTGSGPAVHITFCGARGPALIPAAFGVRRSSAWCGVPPLTSARRSSFFQVAPSNGTVFSV